MIKQDALDQLTNLPRQLDKKQVGDILKQFAYPFSYAELLGIKPLWACRKVNEAVFTEILSAVSNCDFGGIGQINVSDRIYKEGRELYTVVTDCQSAWVISTDGFTAKTVNNIIIKADGLENLVLSNTLKKNRFRTAGIPYLLALRHCEALGYIVEKRHGTAVFRGKK